MEGEAKLPAPPPAPLASTKYNLVHPNQSEFDLSRSFTSTTSSSSAYSSSSSPGNFVRNVQGAIKRLRPLGTMQLNNIRPMRTLVPQRGTWKNSGSDKGVDCRKTQEEVLGSQGVENHIAQTGDAVPVVNENQVDASITLPSISGTITDTYEGSTKPFDAKRDQPGTFADYRSNDTVISSRVESKHDPLVEGQKKVQFSLGNNSCSHEMECDMSCQPEPVNESSHDVKHQNFHNLEGGCDLKSEGADSSFLAKRTIGEHMHQFTNFLHSDLSHPMTQSSAVGSSCATTTLVNSACAPMRSSMTYCPNPHPNCGSSMVVESLGDCKVNSQSMLQGNMVQPSYPSSKCTSRMSDDQTTIRTQAPSNTVVTAVEYDLAKELQVSEPKEGDFQEDPYPTHIKLNKGQGLSGDVKDLQCRPSLSKNSSSDVKVEPSKSENVASGKVAPRKKTYDPDLFFKVNGTLYQRLGKIGSGGSSEVHKVISSDCKIYALKKIKLKGRDYATACGFCQEIEYLKKLKGKSNIIQLIDYEVTDRTVLQEVMNGSLSNKDGRVKDDGYIYMVLEYGEIDLAHMLSLKWKEMDSTNSAIDENWLRFYWQQILLAVNTIHEERIVHSDLKPANFLLVRGSLKLIDFGIAKAIMSDTTNIQRDSQVGTLSYMSPEAFMCNETDANGNTIKCGRPSDIWSLGCILYQMVYGRTPFAEFKTFWAKFKVITDPNHEITYEPVSNPWLLDLMKKCLAWDRKERWRIPQLLQHPFLVPPVPPQLSSPLDRSFKLLQLVEESCANNQKALVLCNQLQELLNNPGSAMVSQVSVSRDEQRKLLSKMSSICCQLQEQLAD